MAIYICPADPATGPIKLNNIKARAKRRGYAISHNKYTDTWSLVDVHLKRPLVGYDDVDLIEVVRAVLSLPARKPTRKCSTVAPRRMAGAWPARRGAAFNRFLKQVRAAARSNAAAPAMAAE